MLSLLLVGLVLTLAGCGGSGAGAGGGSLVDTTTKATTISVTASAPQIASAGGSSVTLTAFVKDASNRTLANQPVSFSTTDAGTQLQVASATTDASGQATATMTIGDKSNRTITVTATSGALSGAVTVSVTGTSISLSGPSSIVFGAPTPFTVQLRDSDGAVLAGRAISVTSSAGNTLSSSTATTDATGQATINVTGSVAGSDTLGVTGMGATATKTIAVSGTQLTFSSPTASQELVVNAAANVRVTFLDNGAPQVGQQIQFTATRGTLSAVSAVTDVTGSAAVTITSPTAGIASIEAIAPNGVRSTQLVEFIATTPGKISLRSSPSTVPVNLSSAGTNSSSLIAVVRDANDNPVKGVTVSFQAVSDPSNGRISPASATTDSSGVASVAFFPGGNSTGNGQIVVQASVGGVAPVTTNLTAAAQSISVRIATGNEITKLNDTTNQMPWNAIVVDTNGSPVADATITPSLVGVRYLKGRYAWSGTVWFRVDEFGNVPPFSCLSEDANENARLDAGEDLDVDGKLEPGGAAAVVVTSTNGKTDSSGLAYMNISYGRSFGGWVEVRLRVTITTVAGTEGFDEQTFVLPVLSADLTDQNVSPPGNPSPFGVVSDCANPG